MFGHITTSKVSLSLLDEYGLILSKSLLRQRANFAERVTREEAERTSQLKSDFIANMSHELRTPLNAIMGFSELISNAETRQLDIEKITEYATIIHGSAQHLLTIINDILDISKLQSGRLTLDPCLFDLSELIASTVALLDQKAHNNGIELVVRITPEISQVYADESKIRQILINLIDNAIKYTASPGTVSISLDGIDDTTVSLCVIDTGIGMTDEELELARIPFGQVDSCHARMVEGTGLGLPIAEALVKLHGGKMDIMSARNIGTQIQLLLPVNSIKSKLVA